MCGGRTLAAGESRQRLSNQRPVLRSRDPSGPITVQYSHEEMSGSNPADVASRDKSNGKPM